MISAETATQRTTNLTIQHEHYLLICFGMMSSTQCGNDDRSNVLHRRETEQKRKKYKVASSKPVQTINIINVKTKKGHRCKDTLRI